VFRRDEVVEHSEIPPAQAAVEIGVELGEQDLPVRWPVGMEELSGSTSGKDLAVVVADRCVP
jgi:hypothetical protein